MGTFAHITPIMESTMVKKISNIFQNDVQMRSKATLIKDGKQKNRTKVRFIVVDQQGFEPWTP